MGFFDRLFGKKRASPPPALHNVTIRPVQTVTPGRVQDPTGLKGTIQLLLEMGWGCQIDDAPPTAETREWFADGEELAEGDIIAWLEKMRPYLEGQGATLESLQDVEFGENYRISVNGRLITIYEDVGPDCWLHAAVAAARTANWLLEQAGSPDRCYMLYTGGNEGIALFMTPEQYQSVVASPDLDPRDRPDDFGSLDHPVELSEQYRKAAASLRKMYGQ